jgi:hypothetical protein
MRICLIPGCGRPVASIPVSASVLQCRYHVQFKSRHGSHWCPTYRAADLKPYILAAASWLQKNGTVAESARMDLAHRLAFSGRIDPAMNLKGRSAAYRAEVAFARLRQTGVTAERLLSIYLGVAALIEDDRGSHRVREFRVVQAAKAAHRLASGTHRRWEMWNPRGAPVPTELHVYPRSSGLVLRKIGEALERAAEPIARAAISEILRIKTERFGPHRSHLPGWRPAWDKRAVG